MSSSRTSPKRYAKPKTDDGRRLLHQAVKEFGESDKTLKESMSGSKGYVTTNYSVAFNKKDQLTSLSELQKGLEVMEALGQISKKLTVETNIITILENIAESVATSFGVKKVNFWDYTPDKKAAYIIAAYGMQDQYIANSINNPMPLGKAWIGRTMESGQAWATSDVQKDPLLPKTWLPAAKKQDYHGLLCLPLKKGDEIIGGMCLYHQDVHEWSYLEFEAMNIVANQAATALVNSRSFDALAAEKSKITSIINSLHDGLVLLDPEQNITLLNPEAERLLEISTKEAMGMTMDRTIKPKQRGLQGLNRIIHSKIAPYEIFETEIETSHPVTLQVTLVPVYDDHAELLGNLYVLHDTTKEREIELMKSNFISVASHQIRTPLTGVSWAIRALLTEHSENLTEEQLRILNHMSDVTQNFADLVDDLLDVSRIDEGRMVFSFEQQDIYPTIQTTVKTLTPFAIARSISLQINEPKKDVPQVYIDSKKLSIAIQNIIDNALKYSPSETGKVTVEFSVVGDYLEIAVSDNGIGIPAEEQNFVFNKFFRAKNAVRTVANGSGLGLYITKQIIEQHNGSLSFSSAENEGSTFRIALPIKQSLFPISTASTDDE